MSAAKRDGPSANARSTRPDALRARFGPYELDEPNASLSREGKAIALAPTPFAVLCALVRQPGSLLTKQVLLDEVWGHQFVSESVLKTVISELRTVLEDNARNPRFIQTVSRRGYRFIAPTAAPATQSAAPASRVDLPVAPSFIGRREALSRLGEGWAQASGGHRSILWVAGDPGIGKTTLIEHFIAGIGDGLCIRGQCVEQHGGGEPYLPVLEALAELCRRDGKAAPLLRAVAPTWLLQLPWLTSTEERDALRRELAGVGPERMLREMGELLDRYTAERPVLLVTEDLHWSDRATIQLVEYIARRRGGARFMWLASFRLADVVALDHPLNPSRRELRLHRLCEEIVLDPFSEQEIADYLAQRLPAVATDEAFIRALHERTDGLPLFVASVVSEVAARDAQGADGAGAAAHVAKIAVPENLAAIIDHYIARLGSEQRALLSVAAVCGVEFRVATVAAALERDAEGVAETCDELEREHLWLAAPRGRNGGRGPELQYSFRHALFRQVLYDRTAVSACAQLHRKVGGALERERTAGVPVAAAELASHYERGREAGTAARYYAEAAEAALLHFSPAECMTLAERGLSLLEQAPEGAASKSTAFALATLIGVSSAHLLGIGSGEAKAAFGRAAALLGEVPGHRLRGYLLHGYGLLLVVRAEYTEALRLAQRSHALSAETSDPALRLGACVVEGDVHMLQGRPRVAREWFERGLAAIGEIDARREETFVADQQVTLHALLAIQLLHLGLVEAGRSRLREAHARARDGAQPMAKMIALWLDALFEVRLGNAERVATLAGQMQALVNEFALAQGRSASRWFRGWAEARLGRPGEGYELIREAYEENTRLGMRSGGSETLGYAAEAFLLAGDLRGAREQLDRALKTAEELGERIYLPQLFMLEAAIACARGESAKAEASVRRAIGEARTQEAAWLELLGLVQLCQLDGATADDRRSLAELLDRLPEAGTTAAYRQARELLGRSRR